MDANAARYRNVAGLVALMLTVMVFFVYSFRDALIILFLLNMLIGLASAISGVFPVVGQLGYLWFVTKVLVPVFFGNWFPEIHPNWYVDLLVFFGFINSINASVQWVRIRRTCRVLRAHRYAFRDREYAGEQYHVSHFWGSHLN